MFSKTILDPDAKRSWDYEESASDVIKTSGGDYVVVGTSISHEWPMPNNMDDILIVKLDGTSGNVIWNKKIHLRNFDRATSVVEDNDGNYVLTGFTSSNDSNKSDVFFGKVDPQGNVLTKKAIKITKNYDGGYSISKTADGGFIIGGEAGSSHNEDFMMLKVDQNGNKQWWKKFSDKPDNSAYDAIEASDGNFYLVGKKRIVDRYEDIRIIKTNSKGKKIWDKTYGGDKEDIGEGIIESENNTFVVVAGTFSYGKGGDVMLMKINSDGEVIWQNNYGGDKFEGLRVYDGNSVSGRHLTKTPNGGFLVSGSMGVFKTDSSGSLLWNYSGVGGASAARQAVDGSVIVTGPGASGGTGDLYVVKINSDDVSESTDNTTTSTWTKQLGTSSGDEGTGVTTDSSGNIYVTGYTTGDLDGNTNSGSGDIFLIKYNSSGTKQWTKQLGTSSSDEGWGVTTDSSGNIYVTGYTYGGLDGNTNMGGECVKVGLDSTGTLKYEKIHCSDIFLIKYNSSGTKQWTKQLGTSSSDEGWGVTTDSSGNIYVTGYTKGDLDGNTIMGGECVKRGLDSTGAVKYVKIHCSDIFLVKYNSSGTKQWTKQLGSSKHEQGNDVTTDLSGNIYVTGWTKGGLDGNTGSVNQVQPPWQDIFLVKYNSSGTKQWTKQLSGLYLSGTSSSDEGTGVTTDSSGNIYVTGYTTGGFRWKYKFRWNRHLLSQIQFIWNKTMDKTTGEFFIVNEGWFCYN